MTELERLQEENERLKSEMGYHEAKDVIKILGIQNKSLGDILTATVKALKEIKEKEGRVCVNYETCSHTACKSSYTSWAIADAALNELTGNI